MRNKATDIFPNQDYTEYELIPVEWLENTWTNNRIRAWTYLQSEDSGLKRLERVMIPTMPHILLLLLAVLTFNLALLPAEAWSEIFTSSLLLPGTVALGLIIFSMSRISRVGESVKNEADVNLFQIVDRWIKNRYGLDDLKFEQNLIQILKNEPLTVNYLSEEYYLGTTEVYGEPHLIVKNVHGEAPLKIN